jgi:hypothetical protein
MDKCKRKGGTSQRRERKNKEDERRERLRSKKIKARQKVEKS